MDVTAGGSMTCRKTKTVFGYSEQVEEVPRKKKIQSNLLSGLTNITKKRSAQYVLIESFSLLTHTF